MVDEGYSPMTDYLDSLKKKIMQEINSRAGESLLNGIVFKAVA